MQTFLPYADFIKSAKCLDYRRLGKQRVEARQIYDILIGNTKSNAWINHPCVKMWKGYENALASYHNTIIAEWIFRGYKNNMSLLNVDISKEIIMPEWLNDEFCSYHRATLLYKNYDWYKQFNWSEKPKYEYKWEVINES